MLRLPVFNTLSPTNLDELSAALTKQNTRIVAGGTDLLPNLKHRLEAPQTLVSLDRVTEMQEILWEDNTLRIGAGVTLSRLSQDNEVGERFPSLVQAAGLVASPLLRNMATLGGNVNLDTRCRYVNQSEFWRSSIGGCLKSEGDVCHVVPKGRNCVAALSSDCVPVLISLNASLRLCSAKGTRDLLVGDYYSSDGIKHTLAKEGEFTLEIRIPIPSTTNAAIYSKWAPRQSIDFPLVSIAMNFTHKDAVIEDAMIVVGVLAAKAKVLRTTTLQGLSLRDATTAQRVGELCYKQGKPLENVPYSASYRRDMLAVFAKRAVLDLAKQL